ncbi:MAG: alpha/beta hydrolase, partial [Nocardioidaceae bacterium]
MAPVPDPRSVLTRPAPPPDRVLRYDTGPDHVVDLYLPRARNGPAPLIVLLHGGFWRDAHDRTHSRPLADALRLEGYAVAVPEYRRTPAARWPQVRDDIVAVRESLPSLLPETVAPGPYRLLGHSAGGHLALWWGLGAPHLVARVVALAPVADLARAYADDLGD